jgi:hypothetical protein
MLVVDHAHRAKRKFRLVRHEEDFAEIFARADRYGAGNFHLAGVSWDMGFLSKLPLFRDPLRVYPRYLESKTATLTPEGACVTAPICKRAEQSKIIGQVQTDAADQKSPPCRRFDYGLKYNFHVRPLCCSMHCRWQRSASIGTQIGVRQKVKRHVFGLLYSTVLRSPAPPRFF